MDLILEHYFKLQEMLSFVSYERYRIAVQYISCSDLSHYLLINKIQNTAQHWFSPQSGNFSLYLCTNYDKFCCEQFSSVNYTYHFFEEYENE